MSAASLSSLIEHAKSSHTSLQAIQHRLNAVNNEYEATRNFANPELSISVSDIQFNDLSNRSIEPMQFTAINFKQKIPYFGKRDANGKKVQAKRHRLDITLEDAIVKLVKEIKITAYTIWQTQEQLRITDEYIRLTKQNIELYTAYSVNDTSAHMGIMSAELSLSQLKIKKIKLKSILEALYKKISYLSAMNVTEVSLSMKIKEPENLDYYLNSLLSNKRYKIKEASIEVANADLHVKELAESVDTTLQVGYYKREKFEDYMNIGISFSLPIYATEKSYKEASRKILLATQNEAADYKYYISSKISEIYAELKESYKAYMIIKEESLPQIEHMADLSSASVKNGSELFIYTQMLEKRLALDEQSVNSVASYKKSLASIEALRGESK